MESNDSPEIPDMGETSDIPGLPSGDTLQHNVLLKTDCYASHTYRNRLQHNKCLWKQIATQFTLTRTDYHRPTTHINSDSTTTYTSKGERNPHCQRDKFLHRTMKNVHANKTKKPRKYLTTNDSMYNPESITGRHILKREDPKRD